MLKKRILLIGLLLVLSIAGQILLRPCLGKTDVGQGALELSALQDAPADKPSVPPNLEIDNETDNLHSELIRTFFYMLGFVALVGVGAWAVIRKFGVGWTGIGGQSIRVGETVRLGPRKAIHLIHAGNKTFLVGSTSDSLCLLADMTGHLSAAESKPNA